MKINGWTEIICDSDDCVYQDDKKDCFYPGRIKLNQKCEFYTPKCKSTSSSSLVLNRPTGATNS